MDIVKVKAQDIQTLFDDLAASEFVLNLGGHRYLLQTIGTTVDARLGEEIDGIKDMIERIKPRSAGTRMGAHGW